MLAARMDGYKQPPVLEEVNIPEISSDQVLVRVGEAGMCRSDVQLSDKIDIPLFPFVAGEFTYHGSFLRQLQRFAGKCWHWPNRARFRIP